MHWEVLSNKVKYKINSINSIHASHVCQLQDFMKLSLIMDILKTSRYHEELIGSMYVLCIEKLALCQIENQEDSFGVLLLAFHSMISL